MTLTQINIGGGTYWGDGPRYIWVSRGSGSPPGADRAQPRASAAAFPRALFPFPLRWPTPSVKFRASEPAGNLSSSQSQCQNMIQFGRHGMRRGVSIRLQVDPLCLRGPRFHCGSVDCSRPAVDSYYCCFVCFLVVAQLLNLRARMTVGYKLGIEI